jgi:hypothetical protein
MRRLGIVLMALLVVVGCTEQPADDHDAPVRDIA